MRSAIFYSILIGMIAGNLLWWRRAHRIAGSFRHPKAWRTVIGLWSGVMFAFVALIILSRPISPRILIWAPKPIVAAAYIWHLLFMLEWLVWRGAFNTVHAAVMFVRATPPAHAPALADATEPPAAMTSRRQFLAAAAIVTPPTLATLAAWRAVSQFHDFRINRVSLAIPNLPPALDGLRIAHVSDLHIGKFTDDALLKSVTEQTNLLRPDLILFTGDLIDFAISDLPAGLAMIQKWDPKHGICLIEGNHDLMSGRKVFERHVLRAGFPMPINDSHSVTIRGQEVQLLGLRWGGPNMKDQSPGSSDEDIAASVQVLMRKLHPGAFPIALAHHPHAFDYLGYAPVPLMLSGHTHGGQLNFGPIRPAELRFRYISGLYERNGRKLFVSNGVGNWFPLRIGAPAEIVDITLRPA